MRILLTVLALAGASRAGGDDLAAAIPEQAKFAIMVAQPAALADKVAKMVADCGLPGLPEKPLEVLHEALPKGVADWKKALGFASFGWSENGSVMLAHPEPGGFDKLPGKDAGDGVKEVEHQGKPLFLAMHKGLVAASPSAETLAMLRKSRGNLADAMGAEAAHAAGEADLFAYFNVPAAEAEANAKLDELEKNLGGEEVPLPAQSVAQFRALAKAGRSLLHDTERAYVALTLDSGLTVRAFAEFRPDSAVGKALASDFAAAPAEPFVGIPDRPYMAAAFIDIGRFRTTMGMIAKLSPANQKFAERQAAASAAALAGTAGTSQLATAANGKFAQFQRIVLAPGAEAAKLVAANREVMELAMAQAADGAAGAGAGIKLDAKVSAETLGGVEFQRTDVTMSGLPEPAAGMLERLMGKPMVVRSGAAKDGTVVTAMNLEPDQWLKDTSRIADNPLTKAAVAKLGERPVALALIDPWGVVELAKEIIPFPLPEHLQKRPKPPVPPFGFSALAGKRGVEFRARIETATVRALAGVVRD